MNNKLTLSVENLSVDMSGKALLKNLTFQIQSHQFISLMGENGIGKTCLLEVICGLRKPSKGNILFWGKRLQSYDRDDFYSKVSWVTATPETYPFGSKVSELFDLMKSIYPYWNDKLAHELCEKF